MPLLPSERKQSDVTERLAVCLFDLERVEPLMFVRLLAGRVDLDRSLVIRVDPSRPDETAVPTKGPVLPAATALDLLRSENRREGDQVTRVYLDKGRGWVRLSANAVLTVSEGGKSKLNPDIFGSQVEVVSVAPTPQRVDL